jgi:hypothetical protein
MTAPDTVTLLAYAALWCYAAFRSLRDLVRGRRARKAIDQLLRNLEADGRVLLELDRVGWRRP